MTFHCAFDDHVTEPGQKQIKVVTEKRILNTGWEIKKEENYCEEHALEYKLNSQSK